MTVPHNFTNTASAATLAASLSSSDTTVALDSFANFPAPPFTATIARNQPTEEIVLVTDVTGLTVTLTRGYDGTSAQAQSPGATFEHTAVAKHFRDSAAHVATTASAHGTTSPVVGADDVQTLSNKTVVALLALATAGAPALTADAPTGVTSKLLSLKQAGVEKAFVDYLGNLTAQAVTGTTGTFSGALSAAALTAAATTLASLGVTGNATVGGTLGVTGLLTATGGVTVTVGKTVAANGGLTGTTGAFTGAVSGTTITGTGLVKGAGVESTQGLSLAQIADPAGVASKQTVWAKSDGGVYSRSGTAAAGRVPLHWGTGTTPPATGVLAGDGYLHTARGPMVYTGTAWHPTMPLHGSVLSTDPSQVVASGAAYTFTFPALPASVAPGMRVRCKAGVGWWNNSSALETLQVKTVTATNATVSGLEGGSIIASANLALQTYREFSLDVIAAAPVISLTVENTSGGAAVTFGPVRVDYTTGYAA